MSSVLTDPFECVWARRHYLKRLLDQLILDKSVAAQLKVGHACYLVFIDRAACLIRMTRKPRAED